MDPFPEKMFYKIGEIAQILGVKPHVLRYWESQFGILNPRKTRSGQRLYRRQDVELLTNIKTLLYEEGFTILGARKRLEEQAGLKQKKTAAKDKVTVEELRTLLVDSKQRQKELLEELRQHMKELISLIE